MTVTINGSGSIAGINDPIVRAGRTGADQALTSGVNLTVVFDGEFIDSANAYNNTTGVFTAPVTGWYQVNWAVALNSSASVGSSAFSVLRRNGVDYRRGTQQGTLAPDIGVLVSTGSAGVQLAAGETLDVQANLAFASGTGAILTGADVTALDIKLTQRA